MNMQARVSASPNIGFSANGERAEKDKGPQMRKSSLPYSNQ